MDWMLPSLEDLDSAMDNGGRYLRRKDQERRLVSSNEVCVRALVSHGTIEGEISTK